MARTVAQIKEINPQLLLYSAYSRDIAHFIVFDKMVKQQVNVKSLIGGPGATFDPQFLEGTTIDALCFGEGEQSVVDYINNGFSPIGNIVDVKSGKPAQFYPFLDLNQAPFPDRALVYDKDRLLRDMPSKQFLSGRGCPYMCTYCHNNIQNRMFKQCGSIIRKKSVDYVLEEIKQVKSRYPLKLVVFQDDTFIIDKKWFFEFCERFPREIGLPYTCNIRAGLIDEEKVRALKQSHCACAYWSIESGNDFIRNKVLKRNESIEQILTTASLLGKYKISHRSGGIVGLPGETLEHMLQTLELNIKIKPNFGFSSIFVPYPGLELTDYAIEKGFLSTKAADCLPQGTHVRSVLNFSHEENIRIQKLTYLWPLFVSYPK
ncbi:MAG: radical SAM protein, partial [Candidatus Omnitrophota bacterium]